MPRPNPCRDCENFVPPEGKRRWTFHEVIPPVLLLGGMLGGWVWFLSGQATAQAEMDRRVIIVEHFKDDIADKITQILVRMTRIETILEKKLP